MTQPRCLDDGDRLVAKAQHVTIGDAVPGQRGVVVPADDEVRAGVRAQVAAIDPVRRVDVRAQDVLEAQVVFGEQRADQRRLVLERVDDDRLARGRVADQVGHRRIGRVEELAEDHGTILWFAIIAAEAARQTRQAAVENTMRNRRFRGTKPTPRMKPALIAHRASVAAAWSAWPAGVVRIGG